MDRIVPVKARRELVIGIMLSEHHPANNKMLIKIKKLHNLQKAITKNKINKTIKISHKHLVAFHKINKTSIKRPMKTSQ